MSNKSNQDKLFYPYIGIIFRLRSNSALVSQYEYTQRCLIRAAALLMSLSGRLSARKRDVIYKTGSTCITYCNANTGGTSHGHRQHLHLFSYLIWNQHITFLKIWSQTDRQTYRHAHRNTRLPYQGTQDTPRQLQLYHEHYMYDTGWPNAASFNQT